MEMLQQRAADDRAQRRARREARGPDGDREPARGRVDEDVADQRQRRRHQHRAEDAERRARGDQVGRTRREGRGGRDDREARGADEQQAAPAEPVTEAAHGDQQRGQHQ